MAGQDLTGDGLASDLDALRARYSGTGWLFTSTWVTAGSGPDKRLLLAIRNGVTLAEWSARALADKIAAEDGG